MLRQKSYVKVSRGGGVNRVVREHYLRDDIPCGIVNCRQCRPLYQNITDQGGHTFVDANPHEGENDLKKPTLNPLKISLLNSSINAPHILVPDTNIFLHHMDVLEAKGDDQSNMPLFSNVVILQTVLEEVKSNNAALFRKIKNFIKDGRFHLFSNEHHKQTFIGNDSLKMGGDSFSEEPESSNDRNDRAIRKAAAWYAEHIIVNFKNFDIDIRVVLLTNDSENGRKAKEDDVSNLLIFNLTDYCKGILNAPTILQDMILSSSLPDKVDIREEYSEHWKTPIIESELRKGTVHKGIIKMDPRDREKATVTINYNGKSRTYLITGKLSINRAIEGDIVYIHPHGLSPSADALSKEKKVEDYKEDASVAQIVLEDDEMLVLQEEDLELPRAIVVGLVRRARNICGSIDRRTLVNNGIGLQSVIVVPLDTRMPRVRMRTHNAAFLSTQRIVVSIDGWEPKSQYPHGHLIRALGRAGEQGTETQAIMLQHEIQSEPFTPQVLACLPPHNFNFPYPDPLLPDSREDLRHLPICSVDPPGCTDIDDALHARYLENLGLIEVGVHIADVTRFVFGGTPLDEEASSRSTTVYLVDRRIDMLPSLLGTNLCSLRSGVDRYAFSVTWRLRPDDLTVESVKFARSIIHSKASLTYDQAQIVLDTTPDIKLNNLNKETTEINMDSEELKISKDICKSLKLLASVARVLRANRIAAGAITLASPEVRFTIPKKLDNETGSGSVDVDVDLEMDMNETSTKPTEVTTELNDDSPIDVVLKETKEANWMVEEFMLLANCVVAARIEEYRPQAAILRRHPAPPAENFDALNRALKARGFEALDTRTSKTLADSLDNLAKTCVADDPYLDHLVRIMTTRCMYQAQYFSSGTVDREAYLHYGLATPIYTHFTSPIRRYADVLVHRLLAASISEEKFSSVNVEIAQKSVDESLPRTITVNDGSIAQKYSSNELNHRSALNGGDLGGESNSLILQRKQICQILDKEKLEEICANINFRHRMAQHAQRASVELYTHLYFRSKPPVEQEAYVVRVAASMIVVLLPGFGVEGAIRWRPNDAEKLGITYDSAHSAVCRPSLGISLTLFQRVLVKLRVEEDETIQKHRLCIDMVEPALLASSNANLSAESSFKDSIQMTEPVADIVKSCNKMARTQ